MKIAVYLADQNPHRDRTRGITNYTHSLLSGLSQRPGISLETFISASSYSFSKAGDCVRVPWRTDNNFLRIVTDNCSPLFLEAMKPNLVYYPKGYISFLMRPRCPVVGTVHDAILQHYADHYPQDRSRLNLAYWIGFMKSSIRKFDMILTDSYAARRQVLEFCARYKIKPPAIRVTYAASDYEDVEIKRSIKKDYILHFASRSPHKKTHRLLEIWSLVSQDRPDWPRLKLVGSVADVKEYLKSPRLEHVPCVDNQQLSVLLREAKAVLLPSEIEGFGLPALEGYFHGTPVCFVKGTSIEEILSGFTSKGAFVLDDPASFKQALDDVLRLSFEDIVKIRDGLREKFSKSNLVKAVAAAFLELLAAKGKAR